MRHYTSLHTGFPKSNWKINFISEWIEIETSGLQQFLLHRGGNFLEGWGGGCQNWAALGGARTVFNFEISYGNP